MMQWLRRHVVLYVAACVGVGACTGWLASQVPYGAHLLVVGAVGVTVWAMATVCGRRYCLALRGAYSGDYVELTFLSFRRRKEAEEWAGAHGSSSTYWEVVDRGPWWRRRLW